LRALCGQHVATSGKLTARLAICSPLHNSGSYISAPGADVAAMGWTLFMYAVRVATRFQVSRARPRTLPPAPRRLPKAVCTSPRNRALAACPTSGARSESIETAASGAAIARRTEWVSQWRTKERAMSSRVNRKVQLKPTGRLTWMRDSLYPKE
jgi:hypothetical protein